MNVNYELFKIFYEVYKYGSISSASKVLNISQPAVTQAIKTLENQIGGSLFVRTSRGVTPTVEGNILYSYVSNGLECISNGINKFRTLKCLENGTLSIGTTSSIAENFLIPYLKEYREKYPNIEIKIYNELTSDLLRSLNNGKIDIAIISKSEDINDNYNYLIISELNDIFVSNKKRDKMKIINLLKEDILIQQFPSVTRKNFDNFLDENNLEFYPKMEVVSHGLLINLVEVGFGNGVLTKEFIKDKLGKTLFEIETDLKINKRKLVIVSRKDNVISFAASEFIKTIKKD